MRGLEIVCGGSLYLTSLVHIFFLGGHICKFFLNILLMYIFKKNPSPDSTA